MYQFTDPQYKYNLHSSPISVFPQSTLYFVLIEWPSVWSPGSRSDPGRNLDLKLQIKKGLGYSARRVQEDLIKYR